MKPPRILYICLEFDQWTYASHWSYPTCFGLELGFRACGVEYVSLPAFYGRPDTSPESWLYHARSLLAGQRFDQVWFEVEHCVYSDETLDWIASLAPVRLGIVTESLEINPMEFQGNPEGTQRRVDNRKRNFRYITHYVGVDEIDVDRFNREGPFPAFWWATLKMPESFILPLPLKDPLPIGVFFGTLYGKRQAWLSDPALQGLLVRPASSPEEATDYPALYNKLVSEMTEVLRRGPADMNTLAAFDRVHREIREGAYMLWLSGLQLGAANVNLPQFGKAYASRVIEGMAAGRPVISWEIPGRPKTRTLFEDGKEILLYQEDNPAQLAEHLKRVIGDRPFARSLAENAQKKLRAHHTTERLVRDLVEWLG